MRRYRIIEYRDDPADLVEVTEDGFQEVSQMGDTEFCLALDVADLERRYREAVELVQAFRRECDAIMRYCEDEDMRIEAREHAVKLDAFLAEESKHEST